jgi:hypothetical protein
MRELRMYYRVNGIRNHNGLARSIEVDINWMVDSISVDVSIAFEEPIVQASNLVDMNYFVIVKWTSFSRTTDCTFNPSSR